MRGKRGSERGETLSSALAKASLQAGERAPTEDANETLSSAPASVKHSRASFFSALAPPATSDPRPHATTTTQIVSPPASATGTLTYPLLFHGMLVMCDQDD